jgi:hypothetical protein
MRTDWTQNVAKKRRNLSEKAPFTGFNVIVWQLF